jgi:hypothetical protein
MTLKTCHNGWIAIQKEAAWCTGTAFVSTGLHVVSEWEYEPPAQEKEDIWAQRRDRPIATNLKLKKPVDVTIKEENFWNLRMLYHFAGSGAYAAGKGNIVLDANTLTPNSVRLHENVNGTERTLRGGKVDEFTIEFPKEGGFVKSEAKIKVADFADESSITAGTTETNSLKTENLTITVNKAGAACDELFIGGSVSFKNNLGSDVPDLPNKRAYSFYPKGLEVQAKCNFRLDSDNNFLLAHESGSAGVFDLTFDVKDANSTGAYMLLSGMQIKEFKEPIPTAQKGVIEQEVTFYNSPTFTCLIAATGVDFTT